MTCPPPHLYHCRCLCEIHETILRSKPLVVQCGRAGGSAGPGEPVGGSPRFQSSLPHLFTMQYFVDVEEAEAAVAEDKTRILAEVLLVEHKAHTKQQLLPSH